MELERYEFKVTGNRYDFLSVGPKGVIRKAVLYRMVQVGSLPLYNLAFGDWRAGRGRIDDRVVTDNKDSQKILATVAATVVDFMDKNPHATILAIGTTPSRTRLYQIGINRFLPVITALFDIEGFLAHKWQPFERGRSYDAFLLNHKKIYIYETS